MINKNFINFIIICLLIFVFSKTINSAEKIDHSKIHKPLEKTHNPVQKNHKSTDTPILSTQQNICKSPIQVKNVTKISSKSGSKIPNKPEHLVKSYKEDEVLIQTIYKYVKQNSWNKALEEAKTITSKKFVEMLQATKISTKENAYDEYEIYSFLSNKYPSVKNLNLAHKMQRAIFITEGTDEIDEYYISTNKLLDKYQQNKALIYETKFQDRVKEAWYTKKFSSAEDEKIFMNNFSSIFTQNDYKKRLDFMLWNNNIKAAESILKKVDQQTRIRARARIDLQNSQTIDELFKRFNKFSDTEVNRQILLFDVIIWCEKNKLDQEILELLKIVPTSNRIHNDQWWNLIKKHIRTLLLKNNKESYQLAYKLASTHGILSKKIDYVNSEFFAGFIAYSFLDDCEDALKHFKNSEKFSKQDFRKARAAYWLGLTYEKVDKKLCASDRKNKLNHQTNTKIINAQTKENKPIIKPIVKTQNDKPVVNKELVVQPTLAEKKFQEASKYFTTFYGQLALEKINKLNSIKEKLIKISDVHMTSIVRNPIFRYYYYSLLTRDSGLAKKIAKIITLSCKSKEEIAVIAGIANYLEMPDIAYYIGNIAFNYMGLTVIEALYPIPEYKHLKYNKILNLSVIRRESGFESSATNDAGIHGKAHGLMQIIPAAGIDISKELGILHDHEALLNPQINVMYGNYFLNFLKNKWADSNVLTITSYNAGSGSTNKWVKSLGDFREISKTHNLQKKLIWMEEIPFQETRYYLQSVLSNMTIYGMLLHPTSKVTMIME